MYRFALDVGLILADGFFLAVECFGMVFPHFIHKNGQVFPFPYFDKR